MRNVVIIDAREESLIARGDQLAMDGYEVIAARTDADARVKLASNPEAALLCDAGTPARTLALLRDLRAGEIPRADPRLPVLSVGADDDSQAIRHYQAGADIALPSTASPLLLAAGLETLAARTSGEHERRRVMRVGSLKVDCDARVATVGGQPVRLSRLEFDLLQTLTDQPKRAFTRAELTKEVWGYDPAAAGPSRTLDSHAARLRQKLGAAGEQELVQNIRGIGYRLTR